MLKKKFLKYTILIGGLVLLCSGLVISIYGLNDQMEKADVMVVLGNKVELDGLPSARLTARLDRALLLYESDMAPKIIVSGGLGKEGFDEATVMAEYLINHGVRERDIILDSEGDNTFLTAQHTQTIMSRYGFTSVIVVSHYYHLMRCKLALTNWGVSNVYTAKNVTQFQLRDIYSIFREIVGLVYYSVRDYGEQLAYLPATSIPAFSQAPMPPLRS